MQVADSFGLRHQFRHGSDLHFLHHPLAVRLDRALRAAQGIPGLLIGLAANNKLEDLPFARRQSRNTSANHVQLGLLATRNFMTGYSPVYCGKKLVRRYGLDEEILRTRLVVVALALKRAGFGEPVKTGVALNIPSE